MSREIAGWPKDKYHRCNCQSMLFLPFLHVLHLICGVNQFLLPEIIHPDLGLFSRKNGSIIENERFGLVFAKTGSTNSGTVVFPCYANSTQLIMYLLYVPFLPGTLLSPL